MRRGSSSLLVIFGLFVLLLAGAGMYVYIAKPGVLPGTATQALPPPPMPDVEIVEAALDIQAGSLISDPDTLLTTGTIAGDDYAANPDAYFTSAEDVRNLKAVATIRGGQPVRKEQVGPAGLSLKIPTPVPGQAALKAFPVQVNSLTGVADMVQPGDFVDVMASFNMDVHTFRPGVQQDGETLTPGNLIVDEATNEGSVKVLLQDVQVIDIVKPAAPPTEEEQAAEPETPPPAAAEEPTPQAQQVPQNASATELQDGNWLLVIAVTTQEAEVMRFALDRGIGISTLLRATGDHNTERTVGSTMRILIDNYGMPMPAVNPPVQLSGPALIPNVPTLPEKQPETWAPAVTAEPAQ